MRCPVDAPILVEAESHLIGRIHLPESLKEAMARAPIVMLEATMAERTERLFNDYVATSLAHYRSIDVDPWNSLSTSHIRELRPNQKAFGLDYVMSI